MSRALKKYFYLTRKGDKYIRMVALVIYQDWRGKHGFGVRQLEFGDRSETKREWRVSCCVYNRLRGPLQRPFIQTNYHLHQNSIWENTLIVILKRNDHRTRKTTAKWMCSITYTCSHVQCALYIFHRTTIHFKKMDSSETERKSKEPEQQRAIQEIINDVPVRSRLIT